MLFLIRQQPKNKFRQGLSCVFQVVEAETKAKALAQFSNMNKGQLSNDYVAPTAEPLQISKYYMI